MKGTMIANEQDPQAAPSKETPKRKKKRFTTREEVLREINKTERDIVMCNAEADILDVFADTLRDNFQDSKYLFYTSNNIPKLRSKVELLRGRANRYKTGKLAKLKRVMGEIQTGLLIQIDGSVQMP